MKTPVKAMLVVLLVGFGMLLENLRAQANAPLGEARISHFGFAVNDVEKTLKAWNAVLQAKHSPIHEIKGLTYPPSSNADRNTVISTTEIFLNGSELHLLQPIGGASPWRDHIQKYGDEKLEHIAFFVPDIQATVDALLAKGGKQILGGNPKAGSAYVEMPGLPFHLELNRQK